MRPDFFLVGARGQGVHLRVGASGIRCLCVCVCVRPRLEIRQDWRYMSMGPDLVPIRKSTAIHVCIKIPGRIPARMRFSP